jgi:transcription elongation factor Elf1/FtsZ-binding cell division protein ZapB
MKKTEVDGIALKKAIDQFGSLQKALESLKSQKEALENELSKEKVEKYNLTVEKDKLAVDIDDLKKQFDAEKKKLESLGENFGKWERQYNLFQGFMAMLAGSPSIDTSLKNLISLLQELAQSGWTLTKTLDELRGYFVSTVMGDYLKCYHCKNCGAKFIVNKRPLYKTLSNYYECPSCHTSFGVEADDSFLKAMVSNAQLDDILQIRNIQEENETLKPLKVFLGITCDICGKPITEWDAENVKIAVEKFGWGHTKCWKSDIGELILLLKSGRDMQGKGTK